ncbi:MAG: hypothetical protein IIX91_01690 [Clostridia bacterium]|nr:hypothetical protein [Clostridia bacterium]
MATYMIDYENVKTGGLNGISRLTAEDKVIIFYSENANRLTFDLHRRLMECPAQIEYREVLVGGHNALDFQLVTYLGYLIAKDPMGQYLIISYDRGFEYVVNFWRKDGLCIGLLPYLKDPSYALSKVVRGEIVRTEKEEESPEAKEAAEDAPESVAEEIPVEPVGEIPEETEEGITVEFYEMTETPAEEVPEEVPEAVVEVPAEEAAEAAPAEVTPAEAPAEEPAKPAKKSPAKKKQTAKKPKAVLAEEPKAEAPKEEPKAEPKKEAKKAEPKKDAPVSKLPSEEELKTLLGDLVADDPEVRFVKGVLEKYKTKLGLNNALVKNFGNQRAGEIYQKVKPFASNKKK